MILHTTKAYPDLTVNKDSNNFGDQVLTFTFEFKDGHKKNWEITFPEGSHVPYTKRHMLKLWRSMATHHLELLGDL